MRLGVAPVLLVVLASVTACGGEPEPTKLESAVEFCELQGAGLLGDDGSSLTISTGGEETESEQDIFDLLCVLEEVDVPDHVMRHIEQTRGMDGMQTSSWETLDARWSYHPDSGVDMTLVEKGESE